MADLDDSEYEELSDDDGLELGFHSDSFDALDDDSDELEIFAADHWTESGVSVDGEGLPELTESDHEPRASSRLLSRESPWSLMDSLLVIVVAINMLLVGVAVLRPTSLPGATPEIEPVSRRPNNNAVIEWERAHEFARQGDLDRAIRMLEGLLARDPGFYRQYRRELYRQLAMYCRLAGVTGERGRPKPLHELLAPWLWRQDPVPERDK